MATPVSVFRQRVVERLRAHSGPLASFNTLLVCLTLSGRIRFLLAAREQRDAPRRLRPLLSLAHLDAYLSRPDACPFRAEKMLLRFVRHVGMHIRQSRMLGFVAFRARLAVCLGDWERWKAERFEMAWGNLMEGDAANRGDHGDYLRDLELVWGSIFEED